jgi:hypothetical protein
VAGENGESGHVVIVMGASAGAGRAAAPAFARAGAKAALFARGEAGLEGVLAETAAAGGTPRHFRLTPRTGERRNRSPATWRRRPMPDVWVNAAFEGFNESLRCELMHDQSNVRMTLVQRPAVNTPQFDWVLSRLGKPAQPVPPIYQPEVAARAIVYVAAHPPPGVPGRRDTTVPSLHAAELTALGRHR